jgi:hypothetical protein
MTTTYDSLERRALLDRIFQLFQAAEALDEAADSDLAAQQAIDREMRTLVDRYVAATPILALSRCPFTGEVFRHSLDPFGLDGLWWNSDSPQRPLETLIPTFFAFCGAMQLREPLETAPFIAEPGPGVPYVLPRLLEYQQIKAVLSSVAVGSHQGFVITYFAEPMLYETPRANDWGSGRYSYTDEDGRFWVNEAPPDDLRAFDLEPWIRAGQLLWIRPGDPTLTLRSDLATCPYLDLQGPEANQFVQNGRVWLQPEASSIREDEYPYSLEEMNQLYAAYKQGG